MLRTRQDLLDHLLNIPLRGDIGVGVLEIDRERRTGPAMIKRYDAAIAFGKADPERILIQHTRVRSGRDKSRETDRTG